MARRLGNDVGRLAEMFDLRILAESCRGKDYRYEHGREVRFTDDF